MSNTGTRQFPSFKPGEGNDLDEFSTSLESPEGKLRTAQQIVTDVSKLMRYTPPTLTSQQDNVRKKICTLDP